MGAPLGAELGPARRPARRTPPPPTKTRVTNHQDDHDGAMDDPLLGTILDGRYRLTECLGEGAMGAVYLADPVAGGPAVAVKMLSHVALEEHADQRDVLIERFRREISMTAALHHPNIVEVVDSGTTAQGMPYIVLEYLRGWDLRDVLDEEHPIHPARIARIGRGVALALTAAHGAGVIHRDLKPENILLVPTRRGEEQVKVVDFGIARLVSSADAESRLTADGTAVGTPRYMSPEQVLDRPIVPATDLYSLGVILYEMLTGRVPFMDDVEMRIPFMHVHNTPEPIDVPGMPVKLLAMWQDLVMNLLQKRSRDRIQTAEEVARRLATLEEAGLVAPRVDPSRETHILELGSGAAPMGGRPTRVLGVRTTGGRQGTPSQLPTMLVQTGASARDPSRRTTAVVSQSGAHRKRAAGPGRPAQQPYRWTGEGPFDPRGVPFWLIVIGAGVLLFTILSLTSGS